MPVGSGACQRANTVPASECSRLVPHPLASPTRHLIAGRVGSCAAPGSPRPASHFCRTPCFPQVPAGSVLTSLCSLSGLFQCVPLSRQREERCLTPGRVRRPRHADLGSWGWLHKASRRGQAWPCSGWCLRWLGTFPRPLTSATQQATFSHLHPPMAQDPLFGGAACAFQG